MQCERIIWKRVNVTHMFGDSNFSDKKAETKNIILETTLNKLFHLIVTYCSKFFSNYLKWLR